MKAVKRALLSVSDKTGIVEFAKALSERQVEILSTGGTCELLKSNGIVVTEVSDHTQFPELFAGRVKTLHPKIHGGILARRGIDDEAMEQHNIAPIDLVVVNLYPFKQTIAKPNCLLEEAIENIDIGGPAMIRSAAKNHASVIILTANEDYQRLIEAVDQNALTASFRLELATKAFAHTASYDTAIAEYLQKQCSDDPFSAQLNLSFERAASLRYGENPHQKAALYKENQVSGACVVGATLLQGKPLSYNNLADADAALSCVQSLATNSCVIVKHANPCGVGQGDNAYAAYQRAFACDTVSAFGGIIAFNQLLDEKAVAAILEQQFVEVIIAPQITTAAQTLLAQKPNLRVLTVAGEPPAPSLDFKKITGGLLVQQQDALPKRFSYECVTKKQPTAAELSELEFAWTVALFVKSNAIVYAKQGQTIGIGAGQTSRVDSANIAALKAENMGFSLEGAVMASDAFFPFRDSIDVAARAGIQAIVQPGGSVRDEEVITACNEHGIAMIITGERHFRH